MDINFDSYVVTKENVSQLVNIEKGYILNPFIGYGGWSKIADLYNPILPNMDINAKFYRVKSLHKCKTLHTTNELEIVDKEIFKDQADILGGTIEQYIGDGEIVTEIHYRVKEDADTYLKRVKKVLLDSYIFYSQKGYEKRFYMGSMSDGERVQFTSIILENAKTILDYLDTQIKLVQL